MKGTSHNMHHHKCFNPSINSKQKKQQQKITNKQTNMRKKDTHRQVNEPNIIIN
jgi:hypothetical protein